MVLEQGAPISLKKEIQPQLRNASYLVPHRQDSALLSQPKPNFVFSHQSTSILNHGQ